MKRILLIFSIAVLFLMAFATGPAFAGESNALIDKLVDKGVISQSEADELSEDMKDHSDLVKALKGISIGGTYFLEYYKQDYDDNTQDFNSFRVQRAYVTIKKKFNKWFSTRVTSDIVDSDEGNEFRLKYAYGKFDFKKFLDKDMRLESEVGLVHTASDDYDAAIWPYRAQGKHFLDRHSIMSSADYGLNVRLTLGEMDKEFKKDVSKKYAAKWGGIWAGYYNGAGYGTPGETNDDKVVEALVYVRPFNAIAPLKGLRIGYHIARGEADSLLTPPDQYPDWEIDQIMVSFQHKDFTVMYQNYSGKGEDKSSDQNDRDGYNVAGFVKMPFNKKMKVFARYDLYDDDDTQPNDDEETMIYGLSYDLEKGVMAWAAIEDIDYEDPASTDHKDIQIGLAVSF